MKGGGENLFAATKPTRHGPLSLRRLLLDRAIDVIDRLLRVLAELVDLAFTLLRHFGDALVQLGLGAGVVNLTVCQWHSKTKKERENRM